MVTIKEIAHSTGYSVSTVTKVLRGQAEKYNINADTAKIITKFASKSDYVPSLMARSLQNGNLDFIAIVGSIFGFYNRIIRQNMVATELRKNNFRVMMFDLGWEPQNEKQLFQEIASLRPSCILVSEGNLDGNNNFVKDLLKRGNNVIALDYFEKFVGEVDQIFFSREKLMEIPFDYFFDAGHRKIKALFTNGAGMYMQKRIDGIQKSLQKHKINASVENYIIRLEMDEHDDFKTGYRHGLKFDLQSATAVVPLSDKMTIGFMRALTERGVDIAHNLSIISAEMMDIYNFIPNMPSGMMFDMDLFAKETANLVLNRQNNRDSPFKTVVIDPFLRDRELLK